MHCRFSRILYESLCMAMSTTPRPRTRGSPNCRRRCRTVRSIAGLCSRPGGFAVIVDSWSVCGGNGNKWLCAHRHHAAPSDWFVVSSLARRRYSSAVKQPRRSAAKRCSSAPFTSDSTSPVPNLLLVPGDFVGDSKIHVHIVFSTSNANHG